MNNNFDALTSSSSSIPLPSSTVGGDDQQHIFNLLREKLLLRTDHSWMTTDTETSDSEDTPPRMVSMLHPSIEFDDQEVPLGEEEPTQTDQPSSYSSNSTDAPPRNTSLPSSSTSHTLCGPSERDLFTKILPLLSIDPESIPSTDIKTRPIDEKKREEIILALETSYPLEEAALKTGAIIIDSNVLKFKEGSIQSSLETMSFEERECYWISASGLKYGISRNEDRASCHLLTMEGSHSDETESIPFFGIYDGHGGEATSSALEHYFPLIVQSFLQHIDRNDPVQIKQALKVAFVAAHELCGTTGYDGATALIALIIHKKLWVASAGDCRAVLSTGDRAIQLSRDGIPTRKPFKYSLKKRGLVGGYVYRLLNCSSNPSDVFQNGGQWSSIRHPKHIFQYGYEGLDRRVLDPSENYRPRCQPAAGIGDPQIPLPHRPKVNCVDLTRLDPTEKNFILLGTDGVFDALDSAEIPLIVQNSATTERVAKNTLAASLSMGPDKCDNSTVIAIKL